MRSAKRRTLLLSFAKMSSSVAKNTQSSPASRNNMDQKTRTMMLAVMAGDRRVMPFLFAINGSKYKSYVLHFLITKGICGAALFDFIEKHYGGNPMLAASDLSLEVQLTINRLM